jgi:succinate dehydrogenase flavin-adding protein (antitoxin of CptAB toxin-antitoxin module)
LDTLLCHFLEFRFDGLAEPVQRAFANLLEQQDPTIADWLWGRAQIPANEIGDVIRMIRADSGLDQIQDRF